MAREFQRIAQFDNPLEAEQLCAFLKEHGLRAFVEGADLKTTLSYMGAAVGDVRVLVPSAEVDRAAEIIALMEDESGDGQSWFCGPCQEEVEAGFAICWSCGQPRTEVEVPFPEGYARQTVEDDFDEYVPPELEPSQDALNPYTPPRVVSDPQAGTMVDEEYDAESEALVQRAWRTAIIGLALFPPVLHIYSIMLLLGASAGTTNFSPQARRRYFRAWVVDLLAITTVAALVSTFARRF